MTPSFPVLVQDALDRQETDQSAQLTRPIFAAAITYLALSPRSHDARADRARATQVLTLPLGPDWINATLREFLESYRWHILFAHCQEALDLAAPHGPYDHRQNAVPLYWQENLYTTTPQDFPWISAYAQVFNRCPIMPNLVEIHLGDPAWDQVWTDWLEHSNRILPCTLIKDIDCHPALAQDPTRALAILKPILAKASLSTTSLDQGFTNRMLAVMLGNHQFGWTNALKPRPDHAFAMANESDTLMQIFGDANTPEARAAFDAAFPSPKAFLSATLRERAAFVRSRVFGATAPKTPATPRAPVQTAAIKAFLAQHTINYSDLPNLAAYEQRCREALASGRLPAAAAAKVRQALTDLDKAAAHPTVIAPQGIAKGAASSGWMRTNKYAKASLVAISQLGAHGHAELADAAIAAQGEQSSINSLDSETALLAFKSQPSPAGMAWIARTFSSPLWIHAIPDMMEAAGEDAAWRAQVFALIQGAPQHWLGATTSQRLSSFMVQGGPWMFARAQDRIEWVRLETQKPQRDWDLAPSALSQDLLPVHLAVCPQHHQLHGLLRLSLALRDGETCWMEAFIANAQRSQHYALWAARKWAKASGHQRLAMTKLLRDTDAILAMEADALIARIEEICAD